MKQYKIMLYQINNNNSKNQYLKLISYITFGIVEIIMIVLIVYLFDWDKIDHTDYFYLDTLNYVYNNANSEEVKNFSQIMKETIDL